MGQIVYHKNYTQIDTDNHAELSKACMCSLCEIEALKDSCSRFQNLTEEEWSPFRSFLMLCDLHTMKFAGKWELSTTKTENVLEAVMTLPRVPLDADDAERLSVIFEASKGFALLQNGKKTFRLRATYSFDATF